MKKLSESIKKSIINEKEQGKSNRKTAKTLGISHTVVANVLKENNLNFNYGKKGRHKSLNKREEAIVVRKFKQGIISNATNGVDFIKNVSTQYVRHLLKTKGVTAHKRIQKPEISKKILKARKKYYLDHKGKTFDHFKNYIFTDDQYIQ